MPSIRTELALVLLLAVSARHAEAQSVFDPGPVHTGTLDSGFGWSVAGPGDVDQDGFPDALVGEIGGLGNGRVWVVSGKD
ncbi:MAG: integrin alpha, partial [Planctomycetota bacterium JB042]